MSQPQLSNEGLNEVCPNCGKFVDSLNDDGWCGDCSGESPTPSKSLNGTESRLERWLNTNADTIEEIMVAREITAIEAIRIIAQDTPTVATCAVCGSEADHVRHDKFFCSKTQACLKARRYYKYLVYEKGMSKTDAFDKAESKYK